VASSMLDTLNKGYRFRVSHNNMQVDIEPFEKFERTDEDTFLGECAISIRGVQFQSSIKSGMHDCFLSWMPNSLKRPRYSVTYCVNVFRYMLVNATKSYHDSGKRNKRGYGGMPCRTNSDDSWGRLIGTHAVQISQRYYDCFQRKCC